MIRTVGTPLQLDAFLRPMARIAQLVFGLLGTAILIWLDLWWWVPLPLAFSFIAYELFFWWRGDRPSTLELTEDARLDDPQRSAPVVVRPSEVTSARLAFERDKHGWDVWVVLAYPASVALAARFRTRSFEPAAGDLDVARMAGVLGGRVGVVRALGPTVCVGRQRFEDRAVPSAIAWIRTQIPRAAWEQTSARLWRGSEPDLDLLGLHTGEPDAFLTLTGSTYRLVAGDDVQQGECSPGPLTTALRRIVLLLFAGEDSQSAHRLPLLVFDLAPGLTLAIPALNAPKLTEKLVEARETWHHAHLAEGAAIIDHLLRYLPEALPEIRTALSPAP